MITPQIYPSLQDISVEYQHLHQRGRFGASALDGLGAASAARGGEGAAEAGNETRRETGLESQGGRDAEPNGFMSGAQTLT